MSLCLESRSFFTSLSFLTFMTPEFDPYYTWLGIPPEEQPPHHYRLLGIRALEADRDVITHAMDQRMAHLRTLQSGRHSAHSQRLLNEVSAAAVVLLDPALKAGYDAALQQQQSPPAAAVPPAVPPPIADVVPPPRMDQPTGAFPPSQYPPAAIIGGIGVLLLIAVAFVAVRLWVGRVELAETTSEREQAVEDRPGVNPPPAPPIEHPSSPAASEPPAAAQVTESPNPTKTSASPPPEARPEPHKELTPSPAPPMPSPAAVAEAPAAEPTGEVAWPPTAEEIEAAQAKVVEIFGGEARQAQRPEQKLALANRMSQIAGETNNDLAVRYALLDAARRLYAVAGEVDSALAMAVVMADEFEDDGWELRLSTFSAMCDAPLSAARRDRLASVLVTLVDQAVAEEEFASAEEFARLAVKAGNRSSDASVRRLVVQKRSELTRLKDFWQAVEQARSKLEADANDPAANLLVGKFLCFVVADFEQGIPHLVRSGREPFAAAALADQAASHGPQEGLNAGDLWYALAESVKSSDKELVPGALLRARHWYQQVVPQLSGLEKARIEKRIQETNAIAAAAPPRDRDGASPAKAKWKKGKSKRKGKGSGTAASGQAGPGLVGRGMADGRDCGCLFTYQPGHRFTADEIAELEAILGPGQRQVELLGTLSLSADADVTIHHAGGSSNGGVHTLYLDGNEMSVVGDDRTKDETRTLPLTKGEHAIRWVLTGGDLGSALLEFSVAASAARRSPTLEIFHSQQLDAAARAAGVRQEKTYGP